MATPRWRIWLHRIGYAATAIVLAEALAIGFVLGKEALQRHRWKQAQIERTAAHAEPLQQPDYLLPYLHALPPIGALGRDGLRIAVEPALSRYRYAAALRLAPGVPEADGVLLIFHEAPEGRTSVTRHAIALPAADYRALTDNIDRKLSGFEGGGGFDTGGTDIGIERRSGDSLMSGTGNFIEPYRSLGEDVLRVLRRAAPGADLPPAGADWYRRDE